MRVLVTGGAGFLGSHLCERLLNDGHSVICIDSLLTGDIANTKPFAHYNEFSYVQADVSKPLEVEGSLDWIMHLACPASPADFPRYPIEILEAEALGTFNCLGLAREKGAGFFLASTSEVYGDPVVHPQPETYWGNVNPIGPRSPYDEGKRFAEALTYSYLRTHRIPVRVVRIFNTYGPRMRRDDGRSTPNFIIQALRGDPITVHGDGSQTRSPCYVDDMINGFMLLLESEVTDPVNIGNPTEISMLDLAQTIKRLAGSDSEVVFTERPADDPAKRQPDITRAKELLGWEPKIDLKDGLQRTIDWCKVNWL